MSDLLKDLENHSHFETMKAMYHTNLASLLMAARDALILRDHEIQHCKAQDPGRDGDEKRKTERRTRDSRGEIPFDHNGMVLDRRDSTWDRRA